MLRADRADLLEIDRPATALLLLLVTAASEGFNLRLSYGKSEQVITLVEAAVAANLLLFSPAIALYVTLAGIFLAHALQRRAPLKLVFNVGQYAAATSLALAFFYLVKGQAGPLEARGLFGIALGMGAFGIVNTVAVDGVVALLEQRRFFSVFREGMLLWAINVMGNTAVGILAAVLWSIRPPLTVLLLVPAFTLHLAYRGVVRGKELLSEVETERDRLERVILGASDGIVLLNESAVVEMWSPAVAQLTGVAEEEAIGRPIAEVLTGRDVDGVEVNYSEILDRGTPEDPVFVSEMTVTHARGGERIVLARHSLLFDERGAFTGDVVLLQDVTRQREVEKLKDDFVSRVSHELRTPLTPIKGYAQTLLKKGDEIPLDRRLQALQQMVDKTQHMERLIEDLLLVSRVTSGRASLSDQVRIQVLALDPLVERVVEDFRTAHPERAFDLNSAGPFEVSSDPTRVEQILANLLSNACKYSDGESPIAVVLDRDSAVVNVRVSDRGLGIPADHLERIFDRFHRVEDPMTMTTGGLGLGLYISRELAVAMGGKIEVESELGKGSTFTLALPLHRRME